MSVFAISQYSPRVRTIGYLLGIFFVLTLLSNIFVHISTRPYVHPFLDEKGRVQGTAIILGTTPKTVRGEENTYFARRIEGAATLYKRGVVERILVSGDNRTVYYNEPRAMKKALISYGIPEEHIIEDFGGRDTYDSILRSRDIFGIEKPIIITQRYHAERALFIAHWNDIPAIAYVVPGSENVFVICKQYVREYFARLKMFSDIMRNRSPSITGVYEPIYTSSK